MCLEAFAYQELPFEEVVRVIRPPRDPSRNPIVQVMFSFHDSDVPALEWPGVRGVIREESNGTAKFDINIISIPREERRLDGESEARRQVTMFWEYNTAVYERADVQALIERYLAILEAVVVSPESRVEDLARGGAGSTPAPEEVQP